MGPNRAKGEMGVGDSFMMQSVTGAVIRGEILSDAMVGDGNAIIRQISGTAQITGTVSIFV